MLTARPKLFPGKNLFGSDNGGYGACERCARPLHHQQRFCSHACYSASLIVPLAERFWAKVEKTESCWIWTAGVDAYGYGQVSVDGHPTKAHRVAWLLVKGPIPTGAHVLHRCDRPRCVNAERHLFLGDQAANIKDAAAKGRMHVGRPRGRVLSAEAMEAILTTPSTRGVGNRLAAQYGVSQAYISLLRRGMRRWKPAQGLPDMMVERSVRLIERPRCDRVSAPDSTG